MPRLSKIGAAALAAFGWTSGGAGASVTASYLVVAGGGAGGSNRAGGGGAGGLLTGSVSLSGVNTYTITVGAGGTGYTAVTPGSQGGDGSNSVLSGTGISTVTTIGGGGGGTYDASPSSGNSGRSGGSGGGCSREQSIGSAVPGSGTAGQGYAGGDVVAYPDGNAGGGGGGAGGVGGNGVNNGSLGVGPYAAGNGGVGVSSSISGVATYYAGGGGGGVGSAGPSTYGIGGNGGGGNGTYNGAGGAGTANSGGGGGGGGASPCTGGNGGSGIVIISYAGAQQFGGGIVTSVGGNTIHTFNTSGTLSPLNSLTASYLIVAGGGGGGGNVGGGGGGGGLLSGSSLTIDTNSTYLVTVGAGGAAVSGTTGGNNGSNSSFSLVSTAAVGGGGGSARTGGANTGGSTGGSGGGGAGGSSGSLAGFAGTAGQGNTGGTGQNASTFSGGGGGGAGAVGSNATVTYGGNGGAGSASSISGTSTYYAGGGGGGANISSTGGGTGGTGGGGNGTITSTAYSGTANTGGGGGGGGDGNTLMNGGAGGSGIVIISYPGSTQQMAGGTVTIVGGNVIHTFTSSGYLTPLTFVGNSLRFRASGSASLARTPSVSSNRTVWTFSAWVKRGALSTVNPILTSYVDTSNYSVIDFYSDDTIRILNYIGGVAQLDRKTTQVFRDPAAWYHLVFSSNGSNGFTMYVNGVAVTAYSSNTGSNSGNWLFNYTNEQRIGREEYSASNNYFDGYMANVQFIDGQALAPTAFGTFNSYGVWQPINYGGSYGTNGFYLPFTSNSSSYAGSFNGSNQYLNLGGQTNFAFGTGDFTVEFSLYTTSFTNLQLVYDSRPSGSGGVYPTIYIEATTGIIYYYSDGNNRITGNALKLNTWYHIALSRSSGSTKLFINGVQVGSTYADSENLGNGASRPTIGASGTSTGSYPVIGYVSNFRVVKGSAVYTANFTPPTANLTAITNTQLLTLQNSTIIDNSTNAFTITNNNSVTTSPTYPFATAIFNDQSPAGNNWTPNNISGAFGSTLDYMTDVPTLTSATAANYAVLNQLNSNANITNGNLNLAGPSSNWGVAPSSIAFDASGNYYCEVYINATNTSTNGIVIGLAQASVDLNITGSKLNAITGCWGWQDYLSNGGNNFGSGAVYSLYNSGVVFATGDTLGIQVSAGSLIFYKNGVSQGTAASGITGQVCFAVSAYDVDNASFNFGQQPFKYSLPSGAVALNTYNM